jgi:hypothetical protein
MSFLTVPCPACGHTLTAAESISHDETPRAGDCSVCIKCATPLLFTDDGALRMCSDEDLANLEPSTLVDLLLCSMAVRALQDDDRD